MGPAENVPFGRDSRASGIAEPGICAHSAGDHSSSMFASPELRKMVIRSPQRIADR